mgnify:FL=1
MIQYNTLYQSLKKVSAEWHAGTVLWEYSWFYLKFFEDGSFINALYTGDDFEKINSGFNKEFAESFPSRGKYIIEKNSKIKLLFNNGIEVRGAITDADKIIINGKLAWELYTPVKSNY